MSFSKNVSVIIPNWNGAEFIADSLSSMSRQTYPDWECLVVDDDSSDASIQIIEAFARQDKRIRLIKRDREPKGGATCRNIGLRESKGEFLIFLDADDILADYCLQQRVEAFQYCHDHDFLVFPQLLFEDEVDDLRLLWDDFKGDEPDLYCFLRFYVVWQTMAPMYRRSFLLKVGGFDERYSRIQDVELACRILLGNPIYKKVFAVPDCFYRKVWGKEQRLTFRQMRFESISYFIDQGQEFVDSDRSDYSQIVDSLIKLLIFNLDNARQLKDFDKSQYAAQVKTFTDHYSLTMSQQWRLMLLRLFLICSPFDQKGLLRIMHGLFPNFWPSAGRNNWGKVAYSGDLTYPSLTSSLSSELSSVSS